MPEDNHSLLSGRYKLIEPVGAGGMAVVYRAWDRQEDREVAVKVLRSEYNEDADFIRRFNMEAQAASKMSHPNVVSIYGVGQDGNCRYIVMEYVHGRTLKEVIRQSGKIEPRRAVQLTLKILAAVNCAHTNHVIHRDIKPQNILVDTRGNIKVADFGIARATNTTTHTYTTSSSMLGSVHYFSPEQANGQVADEKSDLYSVGVVLYEMVTGTVPFDGESAISVAIMHMNHPPKAPRELEQGVSESLNQVILKSLSKDPHERYQSATEMALDLRRAISMGKTGTLVYRLRNLTSGLKRVPIRRIRNGFIALLIVGIVIVSAVFGRNVYRNLFVRIDMPAVSGRNIEEVVTELASLELEYTISEQYSDEVARGTVMAQDPAAGETVWPGDRVTVLVSMGRERLMTPNVLGMTRSQAVKALEENELLLGDVTLVISEAAPGTVVAQVPPVNEWIRPGEKVSLSISGESAQVPNVVGYRLDEAQSRLVAAGFLLGEIIPVASDLPAGEVVEQSIEAESEALMGRAIDLTVSQREPVTYRARAKVIIKATSADTEVLCTLVEASGEREVYRATVPEGEQELELDISTQEDGLHIVRIYLNGEMTAEKEIDFTEEA